MANIPRSPFHAPRPAQDQLWSPGPRSNRGIVDLCTTEQKWFGAPGQVPTKRWGQVYNHNVAESFWNAAPHKSLYIPSSPVLPTIRNHWRLDISDDQPWYGAPINPNISLLTAPVLEWVYQFFFSNQYGDDPSVWTGKSVPDPLTTVAYIPPIPPSTNFSRCAFYVPRPSDDQYWSGNSLDATTIYMPTAVSAQPFVPTIWNFFKASSSA